MTNRSERCIDCGIKARVVPVEDLPVTREKLKELIRTTSFVEIGRQYGVTDNVIRKWCDKFSLPRKKVDILKISDEDWKNI